MLQVDLTCVQLQSLQLGQLDIPGVGGPCSINLSSIVLKSDSMTSFALDNFIALKELELMCGVLTDLKISRCDRLTDAVFALVMDGPDETRSCPQIRCRDYSIQA